MAFIDMLPTSIEVSIFDIRLRPVETFTRQRIMRPDPAVGLANKVGVIAFDGQIVDQVAFSPVLTGNRLHHQSRTCPCGERVSNCQSLDAHPASSQHEQRMLRLRERQQH